MSCFPKHLVGFENRGKSSGKPNSFGRDRFYRSPVADVDFHVTRPFRQFIRFSRDRRCARASMPFPVHFWHAVSRSHARTPLIFYFPYRLPRTTERVRTNADTPLIRARRISRRFTAGNAIRSPYNIRAIIIIIIVITVGFYCRRMRVRKKRYEAFDRTRFSPFSS